MADCHCKQCSKCGESKPLSEYHKRPSSTDGLRHQCKVCRIKNASDWIANNRAQYNARIRRGRVADPSKYKAWERNYRERDVEHFLSVKRDWVARNQKTRKETVRRYGQSHKAEACAKTRLRQLTQARATPAWADLGLVKDFYRLARIYSEATGDAHHVDHIVPVRGKTVCGLHCEANLQVIHGVANRAKSNLHWPDMP